MENNDLRPEEVKPDEPGPEEQKKPFFTKNTTLVLNIVVLLLLIPLALWLIDSGYPPYKLILNPHVGIALGYMLGKRMMKK